MAEESELERFVSAATVAALAEASVVYGKCFETWEELLSHLFPPDFKAASRWDDRKAEIVVQMLREEGHEEDSCEALLRKLKSVSERGREEYFQMLLSSHLRLVYAIVIADGKSTDTEMKACVQVVSSGLGIPQQQVGQLMLPIIGYHKRLSEEERLQNFGEGVDFIKNAGPDDFKKSCYLQYEIIANSDGLDVAEEKFLELVRREWELPESTGQNLREGFSSSPQTPSTGRGGCALLVAASLGGFWTMLM